MPLLDEIIPKLTRVYQTTPEQLLSNMSNPMSQACSYTTIHHRMMSGCYRHVWHGLNNIVGTPNPLTLQVIAINIDVETCELKLKRVVRVIV